VNPARAPGRPRDTPLSGLDDVFSAAQRVLFAVQDNRDVYSTHDPWLAAYARASHWQGHLLHGVSCTESALRLAAAFEGRTCPRNVGTIPTTAERLAQRIKEMGLTFPVYVLRDYGQFYMPEDVVLYSGVPRKDNWAALVFLPDPQHGLPRGHVTVTQVLPIFPEAALDLEGVVYTDVPLLRPGKLYWRAKLTPMNSVYFERARRSGAACLCPWDEICEHESRFLERFGLFKPRFYTDATRHLKGARRLEIYAPLSQYANSTERVKRSGEDIAVIVDNKQLLLPQHRDSSVFEVLNVARRHEEVVWWKPTTWYREMVTNLYDTLTPDPEEFYPTDRFDAVMDGWRVHVYRYRVRSCCTLTDIFDALDVNYWSDVRVLRADYEWGSTADLSLEIPNLSAILSRLALRKEIEVSSVLDVVRREMNANDWPVMIDRSAFQIWLKRLQTENLEMPHIPKTQLGFCDNCLQRAKLHWRLCKQCKRQMRLHPRSSLCVNDSLATYVGRLPIWSIMPTLALERFKQESWVTVGIRRRKVDPAALMTWIRKRLPILSMKGQLCGPMFLGQQPVCYPGGPAMAALAVGIRLLCATIPSQLEVYSLLWRIIQPYLSRLEPESYEALIARMRGDKRKKMQEALDEVNSGMSVVDAAIASGAPPCARMTGMVKQEKSFPYVYDYLQWSLKPQRKPRFICIPHPHILLELGVYTHPQVKWLANTFSFKSTIYYAGCATPQELNQWLQFSLNQLGEDGFWSLADDVSAIDAHHNENSFKFHERVRSVHYPQMPERVRWCYAAIEQFTVRFGLGPDLFIAFLKWVNASGVPDTSYKNSLLCLFLRWLALTFALFGNVTDPALALVKRACFQTAAGDDGLIRIPVGLGLSPDTEMFRSRYMQVWKDAGFVVKLAVYPPHRWRLATYLAMRPVYTEGAYVWAPEPSRRLKSAFWQFDCPMHPIAWARGIATSLLAVAGCVPVISEIAHWYLDNTKGPVVELSVVNQYSPFYGMSNPSYIHPRAIQEFLTDYNIAAVDYERFKNLLMHVQAPYVNFSGPVFEALVREES